MRFLCLVLFILTPIYSWAGPTIIGVRQNIAMSESDTVYRDFYISGGSEQGLKKGMILTVQRQVPLYDSFQNRSAGDLKLNVAKLKVILVQKDLSVARLYSEIPRMDSPLLDNDFIMVGDQVDLSSATYDKKAEAPTAKPQPVAAAAPQAHMLINTVELSSTGTPTAPIAPPVTPTLPSKVTAPVLR